MGYERAWRKVQVDCKAVLVLGEGKWSCSWEKGERCVWEPGHQGPYGPCVDVLLWKIVSWG